MKFKTISKTILIISFVGLIIAPSLNALGNYTTDQDIEISNTADKLEGYDIYRFCYVESGDVDHDKMGRYGIFWPAPPGYGIAFAVCTDLIGWRAGTRLTVTNIFGTKTTYDYDVHVSVKGFIGCAYPTVRVFEGILKGRACIAEVFPLG
jgi:hypothetical protein